MNNTKIEGYGVRRINPHTKEAEWLLVTGKDMGRWVVCFTQGCVAIDVLNKEYAVSIVDLAYKTDDCNLELVKIGIDFEREDTPIVKQSYSPDTQWFDTTDFRLNSIYIGTDYSKDFLMEALLEANREIMRLWVIEQHLKAKITKLEQEKEDKS